MSWGGSVLGMINSLKANARKRPSLRKGFSQLQDREQHKPFTVKRKRIKKVSEADLAKIRAEIQKEKRRKTAILLAVFVIAALLTILFLRFFIDVSLNHQPLRVN
jgi:hypothetical protein